MSEATLKRKRRHTIGLAQRLLLAAVLCGHGGRQRVDARVQATCCDGCYPNKRLKGTEGRTESQQRNKKIVFSPERADAAIIWALKDWPSEDSELLSRLVESTADEETEVSEVCRLKSETEPRQEERTVSLAANVITPFSVVIFGEPIRHEHSFKKRCEMYSIAYNTLTCLRSSISSK